MSFYFSPVIPALGIAHILNFGHSSVYMVVSYYVLICISLMTKDLEHLFKYLLVILFGKCQIRAFVHFKTRLFVLFSRIKKIFVYSGLFLKDRVLDNNYLS